MLILEPIRQHSCVSCPSSCRLALLQANNEGKIMKNTVALGMELDEIDDDDEIPERVVHALGFSRHHNFGGKCFYKRTRQRERESW